MSLGKELDMIELEGIRKGDVKLFEELFRRYYQNLCTYSLGILGDPEKSEDVVQDVFVYVWENRKHLEIKESLKSYLYQSARHGALKVLRSEVMEQKHSVKLIEFIEYLEKSDNLEEELSDLNLVEKEIENLPEQCKTVFLMSIVDGKSYKQIASDLGISSNTVKTHISKAYHLLRSKVHFAKNMILFLQIHSLNK